ncbi:hypothetical protein [Nocardia sp. BMG51109]|uniref:hypothetical protein n=1 Tax=Nocardia sp. BMG51109 TaxID=1056816 RepID=UPI0004655F8E|nr:hypothetical protein [Nocardia sp. BMG51109]
MTAGRPSGFFLEDITVGPFAHGFGDTGDGHPFAFRTVRSALTVEIYRAGRGTAAVPGPEDVVAVAAAPVTDIDLDDERSVAAAVRDLVAAAVPVPPAGQTATPVRALLDRIGSVLTDMTGDAR